MRQTRLLIIIALLFSVRVSYAQDVLDVTVKKQNLNIIFIGNSITYGAGLANPTAEAPPAAACAYLSKQRDITKVEFSNQGHSGYTTLDFLPSAKAFADAEQAARAFKNKKALLIFSIDLGTNDSAIQGPNGSPVSPDKYVQNINTITNKLADDFPAAIIVFNFPIWYSPNTYNGARYLQEGLTRLQSYKPQMESFINGYQVSSPGHLYKGDDKAFAYFKAHSLTDMQAENGHEGVFYLHPNKRGAAALGVFWGKAINKVLTDGF